MARTDRVKSKAEHSGARRSIAVRTTSYQDVGGIAGHSRTYLHASIFGSGMHGKSLLDIGTFHGYFCLEAMKRGAVRAVGLEPYAESLNIARDLAESASLDVTYIETDFDEWKTEDKFDVVICLNVLHHILDPVHAIRRMMAMAKDRIILEFAVPTYKDRKFGVSLINRLSFGSPMMLIGSTGSNTNAYDRTLMFTPAAIRAIFEQQSSEFEPVEIWPSPHKGRYVAVATKRKIKHLTIIAGPTASGKTTLYKALDADMRKSLGIPLVDDIHVSANNCAKIPSGEKQHVVLHYDMLRPFDRGIRTHRRDIATGILNCAEKITFLTLAASQDRLIDQIFASEIAPHSKPSARHKKIRKFYSDSNFLRLWYSSWLQFIGGFSDKTAGSFVIENDGSYRIHTASAEAIPQFK